MNPGEIEKHSTFRLLNSAPAVTLKIALAYAVVAKMSFLLTISPGNVSPIFPAAGIALAAVIILGRNALVGVWLGSFAANAISFFDGTVSPSPAMLPGLMMAAFIGAGAMAGAGAGAFLVQRFCKEKYPLYSGWNVLVLVSVGALVCCVISPTVGVISMLLGGYIPWEHFGYSWLTWWAGDSAGAIVAAPIILAWHHPHPYRKTLLRILEATILGGATLLLCFFVFFRNVPFAYGLMPLLLWAAFRFSMRGVSTTAAAIAIFATLGTSHGGGPFVRDTVNESLLSLHSFLDVTIICAFFLAGILAERKRAEEASRESESRYRELVENANSIILYWTRDGRVLFLNEFGKKFFGFSAEEIIGRSLVGTIVPVNDSLGRDLRGLMDQIAADPKAFEQNVNENMRRNGERVWIAWTNRIVLDEQGHASEFLSIGQDITERLAAERALHESEQRLRLAVDAAQMGIFDWDMSHSRITWSRWHEELWGYSPGVFDGSYDSFSQRIHPDDRPGLNAEMARCLEAREPFVYEFRVVWPDASVHWIASTGQYEFGADGKSLRMRGTVREITARKQAEQQLQAIRDSLEQRVEERTAELAVAKERAESADRLKSAFLATMSHELRTPLNSIIGFTGILLQDLAGPLNAEQRKQLEMVRNSARHLLALINDVLDISKIEAGQLEVKRELFDLRTAILKVAGSIKPLAEKKGLAFRAELSTEIGMLVSDQRRIEQVLINLLNNAIKFTERGAITLMAEIAPVSLHHPKAEIRIAVADTGIGIKPEDLHKLFQPFRQIDTGLARHHEGTGLGLAICRRLADLLGGEINVSSDWGQGSVFILTLPLEG